MATESLSKEWEEFVETSEAISGIAPFNKERDSTKRHFEITLILASASRFIDPRLVNGVLTRRSGDWFRGGTEYGLRGRAPSGGVLPRVFDDWVRETEDGIVRLQGHPEQEREAFAWAMHHKLVCIHPFKEANGRTSRLVLNHLLSLFRLPIAVIHPEKAEQYFAQLDTYRDEIFLPAQTTA